VAWREVTTGPPWLAAVRFGLRWGHPVHRQWLVLLGLLSFAAVGLAYSDWLWRADGALYDSLIPGRPAPTDIVIVAVDDKSVAQLGRWPWPRTLHAELLRKLREQQVKAVALDFIFSETDAPSDDMALANAMRAGPPTVLPVLAVRSYGTSELAEQRPITDLAKAAAGVGHVHLEIDRDGIARSVFLREGLNTPHLSHLALALLEATQDAAPTPLPGRRATESSTTHGVWRRDHHMLIPFLGPPGTVQTLSYVDLLRGNVAPTELRGKYVLVGATAQGLGDAYSTARPGVGRAMPGVEITANIVDALLRKQAVVLTPRFLIAIVAVVALAVVFVGFLRLGQGASLALVVLVAAITLLASAMLLWLGKVWLPPAAAILPVAVAYPLWAWRRLQATQGFLDDELRMLVAESVPLAAPRTDIVSQQFAGDPLQQRIELVREASLRMQNMRRLLADTILSMPDATLVVDLDRTVILANSAAARLFKATQIQSVLQQKLEDVLPRAIKLQGAALLADPAPAIEMQSLDDRHLFIRAAPFADASGERVGTIIIFADVTESRRAQREREEVMRFLSHDIRHPATSLLALAKLSKGPVRAIAHEDFVRRVESMAQRTLDLAEGFVALANAESLQPEQFQLIDLRDAVQDAIDENWTVAKLRSIRIEASLPPEQMWVNGHRQLLSRAIGNLVNNATKHSPNNASVCIAVRSINECWQIEVCDSGPGLPPEQMDRLFQPFQRISVQGQVDPGGTGLGLAFVRVVATRHAGRVEAVNNASLEPGLRGARFSLYLPQSAAL
jgi:CHASE2 domain-containing sensor protein/signal transduction histidine kinase